MIEYAGRTYTENDCIKFYRLSEGKIYLKLQNNLYEFTGKMIELLRKLLDNEVYLSLIHISNRRDDMKKLSVLFISFVMAVTLSACSTAPASSETAYKAGTYTGSAQGMNGEVVVEVEVSDDAILSVKITDVYKRQD